MARGLAFVQMAGNPPWAPNDERQSGNACEDFEIPSKIRGTLEDTVRWLQRRRARRDEGTCCRTARRGKKGAKKAEGLQAVLDRIAQMAPDDRALAERVHAAVTWAAPDLSPKTWYGMPAYADADGKVVVFFQDSGKFNYRYSTLGFQDAANLDDGDIWPVSYALVKWSPKVEKKVVELVKAALS